MRYKAVALLCATLRDTLDMIPHRSEACYQNPAGRAPCFCYKALAHDQIDELQNILAEEGT